MTELFSPNMLKTYDKCPKKYFFKYVKGLQMPVDEDIFIYGKNVHALASYYLKGENIERMEKSLNPKEAEAWEYLKNTEYFKYKPIGTEYSLSVRIGDNYYGGRLDALMYKDDRYFILDYKTGSAPLIPKYDLQTMVYMLSVSKFYNTDNVTFIYLELKTKTEAKVELTPELKSEYESRLSKIGDKIIKGDFTPSKRDCRSCEYGKICYDKLLD